MTVTTKAGLAAELGVSKPCITQYLKRGMPERVDGRLDRETCLNWIKDNVAATKRADRGAARAHAVDARAVRKPRRSTPTPGASPLPEGFEVLDRVTNASHRGAVALMLEILYVAESFVAPLAVAAGAPMKAAYALGPAVTTALMEHAVAICREWQVEPFHTEGEDTPFLDVDAFRAVDWEALAAAAGEPFDPEAWAAHRRKFFGGDADAAG